MNIATHLFFYGNIIFFVTLFRLVDLPPTFSQMREISRKEEFKSLTFKLLTFEVKN